MACFMILVVIPLIIYLGITLGNDRKYYIVSLGIIACTMLPFFMVFEDRKPQARELIIIAVLSAMFWGRGWIFSRCNDRLCIKLLLCTRTLDTVANVQLWYNRFYRWNFI